jgi:2-amino-4-hydroxy-6-hydroxymethyldihydropteridine diphosphokinase
MAIVFLSLGSNLGDRLGSLVSATKLIDYQVGKLIDFSEVVETEPWGFKAETNFYNQVLVAETRLSAQQLLKTVLEIEKTLGRVRQGTGYSNRSIDIDILFYDDAVIEEEELKIPHPLLHKRRFILQPLFSVASNMMHPALKQTIASLLAQTDDKSPLNIAVDKAIFANLLSTKM